MEIERLLKKRIDRIGIKRVRPNYQNVTKVFQNTTCRMFKTAVDSGGKVLALKLKGFTGLLRKDVEPQVSFAIWLCTEVKQVNHKGYISTDELPNYGIKEKELRELRLALGASKEDLIILVAGQEDEAGKSLNVIVRILNIFCQHKEKEKRILRKRGKAEEFSLSKSYRQVYK